MKRLIFLSIIALSLSNCSNKLTNLQLKDYESIKRLKIGMPLKSAIKYAERKYYVKKTEILVFEDKKKKFDYIVYKDESKKTVLFSFSSGHDNQTQDKVFRIVLKNPLIKTVDGISVGMTVKELKEKSKLKSADFNNDDGLFIISDKFDGGFLMDISTIKDEKYNYEAPQINTLPNEMKIKAIILF
ncbi:MAG: hypothetical protein JXR51_15865 [Bacteroidales bacterium]|nr:hypothetical protein [Bacteroidales bacterium]MBN2758647.1 hypothetical protein [Bacteroidales bacterium]